MGCIGRCIENGGVLVALDILVKNVALWGTQDLSDVGIEGGRFVSIERSPTSPVAAVTLDADGRMAGAGVFEPPIFLHKGVVFGPPPGKFSGTLPGRKRNFVGNK